jgi:lipid-A-disaccharide synthase-like uncharacterized protein
MKVLRRIGALIREIPAVPFYAFYFGLIGGLGVLGYLLGQAGETSPAIAAAIGLFVLAYALALLRRGG